MSEFWMVEEFQKFLEAQDPEFVKSELHYFAENNRGKGAGPHTALYPLFLNPRITRMYQRFSKLVWNAVERVVEKARANGSYIVQEAVESPQLGIAVVRGDKVEQIPHYVDHNPPIIGGRMGHLAGRYSLAIKTATIGPPDIGGFYPILTHENPKK